VTNAPYSIPIILFGPLTDLANSPVTIELDLPMTIAHLRNTILDTYPAFAAVPFRIATDGRIHDEATEIHSGLEVALLPPFAGG
jgi:molybdopterin converting factor small subunit